MTTVEDPDPPLAPDECPTCGALAMWHCDGCGACPDTACDCDDLRDYPDDEED